MPRKPCPHCDVKIIQRSNRQSAVASAAYQSGERLFSEYDQKQKYYSHKSEIVHTYGTLNKQALAIFDRRMTGAFSISEIFRRILIECI